MWCECVCIRAVAIREGRLTFCSCQMDALLCGANNQKWDNKGMDMEVLTCISSCDFDNHCVVQSLWNIPGQIMVTLMTAELSSFCLKC